MNRKNGNCCINNNRNMASCCIEGSGNGINPTLVENTILAGEVCSKEVYDNSCMLAQIYFPTQEYRAGFRQCEAHRQGTLFPELVRPFK